MTPAELVFIKDAFSQILDDIAGNPDWNDAASAVSADLGALERELEGKVVSPDKSLEEEIERYLHSLGLGHGGWVDGLADDDLRNLARHFAEWQKTQMLKDAIHYVVQDDLDSHGASYNIPFIRIGSVALKSKGIGVGDKVCIVVLKEEEE